MKVEAYDEALEDMRMQAEDQPDIFTLLEIWLCTAYQCGFEKDPDCFSEELLPMALTLFREQIENRLPQLNNLPEQRERGRALLEFLDKFEVSRRDDKSDDVPSG